MKVQRPLLLPCIIAVVSANAAALAAHDPRQNLSQQTPSGAAPAQPTANTPTNQITTPPVVQTTPPITLSSPPTPQLSLTTGIVTSTPGTSTPATTQPTAPTTPPTASNTPATQTSAPPVTPIVSESVGEDGSTVTSTFTPSIPPTSSPSNTAQPESDDGGGLSTGSIIGMSVAAGIAVIGIVGFFVWKFTRKRFSDFDDNEAIKWPELNTHSGGGPDSHALPARETGRSGFDTGSELDLARVNSSTNYSTTEFSAGGSDPYAVPPLPHLNPNQPYRDDPSYYDPYRGPVPGTIEHGPGDWGSGEAYPMTQFNQAQARASPAPEYMYGTSSSNPQATYGGRASPSPQAAYGGRASPGPQAAYPAGRVSPGPQAAYSAGRASPGPGTAYDAFGAR